MPVVFKTATITSVVRPASTHVELYFKSDDPMAFSPGQFVSIKVAEKAMRSYSLSGVTAEKTYGLIADVKPGGPGSVFFDRVKEGDTFSFLGPLGRFVYRPDDPASRVLFLATGTGVAPFRAMIEHALKAGDRRPMTLYFGLRYKEDIFWDAYFNQLQATYPNFTFVLCLSRPEAGWQGVAGHITDLVKDEHPDLSTTSAYLCGNGSMLTEAISLLQERHMPKENIYTEKFF